MPELVNPRWDIPADWRTPVSEDVSFRTEIIVSRNGQEQRIAQRVNPRFTYSWASTLIGRAAVAEAEVRLAQNYSREMTFGHPRAAVLEQRAVPGFAGIPGRFGQATRLVAQSDSAATLTVEINAKAGTYGVGRSYGAAAATYRGAELVTLKPNWSSRPEVRFEQDVEEFDLERGVTDYYAPRAYTDRLVTMQFTVLNQAQEDALLGWFYRARGRQRAFYIADPLTSLRVAAPVSAGAMSLMVPGVDLARALADQAIYRDIAIQTSGGTIYREVDSIVESGAMSAINVTAALPAIQEADFIGATWLLRARFESDRLGIDWTTSIVGQTRVTVRALEEDA